MAGNFEELHCWQACYNLRNYLKINVLEKLPKNEKFELHSQNIAYSTFINRKYS
tara:strand:+ start:2963 stop:3124 length:162 start_codon:yes stop_codon:yes gene_type:complete